MSAFGVPLDRYARSSARTMEFYTASDEKPIDLVPTTPPPWLWVGFTGDGSCWVWPGFTTEKGYGKLTIPAPEARYRTVRAHRMVWEMIRGPIPEGLELDHLCRNRACVNPDHLEPVTSRTNTMRGIGPTAANATKTHCLRGHEFNEINTYVRPDGRRQCRACRKALRRDS